MNKVLIVLFLFLQINLFAQENLRVFTTYYPPYQMNEDENVTGLSVEIVSEILEEADLTADIELFPWTRAKKLLDENADILFFNLSRTEEREMKYHWIGDITPTNIYLWKLKSRQDIEVNSLADLNNYQIGTLPNVVSHNYLLQESVPEKNFYYVKTQKQSVSMLSSGRIDLLPLDEVAFLYEVGLSGYSSDDFIRVFHLSEISGNSYLVASRGTSTAVVDRLKRSWTTVKENGIYDRIIQKYLEINQE